MWQVHRGITVEGHYLTCEGDKKNWYGARYLKPFSPEFPHFEVSYYRKSVTQGLVGNSKRTDIQLPFLEMFISNFGLHFWVDNTTHFRSFYGLFHCLREGASIVRKTKVAFCGELSVGTAIQA